MNREIRVSSNVPIVAFLSAVFTVCTALSVNPLELGGRVHLSSA